MIFPMLVIGHRRGNSDHPSDVAVALFIVSPLSSIFKCGNRSDFLQCGRTHHKQNWVKMIEKSIIESGIELLKQVFDAEKSS